MSNFELAVFMRITRRLPVIPGMRIIGNCLEKIFLRKKRPLINTCLFGYTVQLNPHEAVERELCFSPQLFDWREIAFLRQNLSPGDVFLDLGSNVGGYSLALSHSIGEQGIIIAVDADSYSTMRLQKTVTDNQIYQIQAVNVGLSDRVEDLLFTPNLFGNRGGGGFLAEPAVQTISVKCITLSHLLAMFPQVRAIRAAKLDLEGCEYKVLNKFFSEAPQTLWPAVLVVERSEDIIAKTRVDVNRLLPSKGYDLIFYHGMNYIWQRGR